MPNIAVPPDNHSSEVNARATTRRAGTRLFNRTLSWNRADAVGNLGRMIWRSASSMGRTVWIAIALLAFGYTLWPGVPAFAAYGAIAWDRGTGKYGVSWNQPTPQRAEEVALSECGATSCKVVTKVGPKMCGALALTDDGKHAGAA